MCKRALPLPPPLRRDGVVQRARDVLGAGHRPEGVRGQPPGERRARRPAGAGRHLRLHRPGAAAADPQPEHAGGGGRRPGRLPACFLH